MATRAIGEVVLGVDVADDELLDDAECVAADEGEPDRAETAEDRCCKAVDREREVGVVDDGHRRSEESAAEGGEGSRDGERDHGDRADVQTDELSRPRRVGRGDERLTHDRSPEEEASDRWPRRLRDAAISTYCGWTRTPPMSHACSEMPAYERGISPNAASRTASARSAMPDGDDEAGEMRRSAADSDRDHRREGHRRESGQDDCAEHRRDTAACAAGAET